MRRWVTVILVVGLVVAAGVFLETQRQSQGPRRGDSVTPRFNGRPIWVAGHSGALAVRLQAQGKDYSEPRFLNFIPQVPATVNPVATITFFDGEEPVSSPVQVVLSHRC
jgi:hypothetical protein